MNPYAVVVLVLALIGGGYYFGLQHEKAILEAQDARQASALANAYQTLNQATQAKAAAYEREIDQLKSDALTYPVVPVRLCGSPAIVPSLSPGGPKLPPGAGVVSTVAVQNSPGTDVGRQLFALADYADEIVAKCRAD